MRANGQQRPLNLLVPLSGCLVFLGVNGIVGGVLMLSDPQGSPMGIPVSYLARTPFTDFAVPGFILVFVWGLGSFVTLFGLWRLPAWQVFLPLSRWIGKHWAWSASILLGLSLIVWLTVQVFTLPAIAFIQFVLYILALLLIVLPMLPEMRHFYQYNGDQ